MNEEQFLQKTHVFIQQEFNHETTGHDVWHIKRVLKNAKTIQENEGGNSFQIEMATLLHEVGDYKLNNGIDLSKTKSFEYLEQIGLMGSERDKIVKIISEVSYKGGNNEPPTSLEAKIVQDADRLDALGAIGIARCFAYGGKKGNVLYNPNSVVQTYESFESYKNSESTSVNHFYEKLLKLKDLMHTNTAKSMAEERHNFMLMFLEQFYLEVEESNV